MGCRWQRSEALISPARVCTIGAGRGSCRWEGKHRRLRPRAFEAPVGFELMRIVISSDPRLLQVLRAVVTYCAQEAGFAASDAESLAMAVDEAASNVIRHTYGNRLDATLALEVCTRPDRLEFVLEDSGPRVQPEVHQPRALEDVRPGGLGTFFIKCFMDASSYDESFAGGNRLKMVKYLSRKVSTSDESPGQERG
jgi:anti-sigma regulatory factor (Ser/Thr protein kinase)